MKKFTLFLGALLISMVSMSANYVKVTEAPADWSGEYLLVYEGENSAHVWTGIDAENCYATATVTNATISGNDFVTITLAPMEGGYSIKVNGGANDGKYISGTNGSNKLNFGTTAVLNTLAYEEGSVKIVSNTSVMRFNNATNNMRFRYFKSSTYTGQKVVQLYKNADGTTPEEPETPDTPDTPEEPETPTVPEGAITCAEAVAICEQVGTTGTTEEYTVRGYITEIKYAWSEQYGTATFWIADAKDGENALQAYSCAPLKDADKVFAVGAYVELVGKLKKFNTTNEVEKGTYTIITHAEGGTTPEEPETPEVTADTITCAEAATIAAAANYVGTDTVTVVGYVTELGSAKDDGSKQCFYMADTKDGGKVFMAYWAFVSKLYVVGDKVAVTGILKNFNGTIEIVDGQSALLEAAAGETPDDGGETPDDDDETPANVTFDFTTKEGLEALGIAYPTTDAGNGAYSTDLEEGKAYSQNGISLTAKYGSTATRIWLAASGKLDLRHYKGGVLTFAAPAGKVITNIVFDGADVSGLATLVDKAWNGSAAVVEIPAASDAKTIKINTIMVHVADASSDYVATPTISGEADFMENTTVTITAEEGLEVYYTLDGTDPTKASTKYTTPFELTATTTVKAVAYNGDKASAVVEKTFTKMTILTCAEAVALCTETVTAEKHIIRGYLTEYQEEYNAQYKNMTFWMADATDGGKVLLAYRVKPLTETEQTLKVGDFVEVVGNLILYGETPEVNAGGTVELITAAETAVENITLENKAMKIIENGQIVILKNGVRYNILGAVVK